MFGRKRNQGRPGNTAVAYPAIAPAAEIVLPPNFPGIQGTAGWRAMPGSVAYSPTQQQGAYNGTLLNQYPAYIPGVQLHSGREWGNPHWFTPTAYALGPNETNLQTTTRPANVAGGQRYGSRFSGPIGPLSVKKNQANLQAAQVRQSGLSMLQWAQGLSQQAQPVSE
jgi:hypothetical protein